MSNEKENAKNRSRGGKMGQNDIARRAGRESQDALRHQQDAAHHKGPQTPQRDTPDGENEHAPQGPSRNHSDGM